MTFNFNHNEESLSINSIKNVSREEKRKRLEDIKAFSKSAHTDIEVFEENLVTRLVNNVVIHDEKVEVELKTGDIIEVKNKESLGNVQVKHGAVTLLFGPEKITC